MKDAVNLYRAPDASIADDFIAVEPIRRPMIYTVAAALCWFMGVTFVVCLGPIISTLIERSVERGWRSVLLSSPGSWMSAIVILFGVASLTFLFAGRSFLGRKGRRGMLLTALAWAVAYAAKFLAPF